ncbi:protein BLISTER-like [Impatiens glandulifera]|uniref:protein BLISTER-like n=1 Tax=Impatiens glandulifera TaxID=253017 RepID=UPI001FB0545B|nr:protein BLISTER-like [Impatiens glandulifera]
MASAQVLPISAKKQEQLEAGKRKLEEYRKKRAAAIQGKKAPSVTAAKNTLNNTNTDLHENGQVRYTGFDEADVSGRVDVPLTETSHVARIKDDKASENLQNIKLLSGDSIVTAAEVSMNSQGFKRDNTSLPSGTTTTDEVDQLKAVKNENDNSGTGSGIRHNKISGDSLITVDPPVHESTESSLQNKFDYTRPLNRDNDRAPAPSFHKDNGNTEPNRSDRRGLSSQESPYPALETSLRKSRPSFLDSISIQRVSSASQPHPEQMKADSYSGNTQDKDNQEVSASNRRFAEAVQPAWAMLPNVTNGVDHHTNSSVSTVNGGKMSSMHKDRMENKGGYYSHKQDEDFASLEQHIEDLTQEKFSLQRTLESSRALAESLATENSGLTNSYNQQGSLVNQLKAEIGRLQEEIKALLVEVESVKMEYSNAHLECNAADERAKLLASEVIGLEEKVLRLRSNELKLERQLEKSEAEISSQKKKMSSLENERRDFQMTIDAMQEEKKLLQSKVWKASKIEKIADVGKSADNRKDVSTSTEDLDDVDNVVGALNQGVTVATHPGSDESAAPSLQENTQFNPQFSSSSIPHDQLRMIQNIDTLLSELMLEKQELLQNLLTESSQSSKLKELNKELSRKLESQTQRLELLTAQNMANGNIPVKRPDFYDVSDNTAYADEGDEVVERVLGWIMKLIPGGSSRRRPNKIH